MKTIKATPSGATMYGGDLLQATREADQENLRKLTGVNFVLHNKRELIMSRTQYYQQGGHGEGSWYGISTSFNDKQTLETVELEKDDIITIELKQ